MISSLHSRVRTLTDLVTRFDPSKLYKAYKDFRRFQGKSASYKFKGVLKQSGNLWLEYSYGIKPLVMSAYGTFNLLMESNILGIQHIRERAKVIDEGRNSVDITTAWETYSVPCTWKKTSRTEYGFDYSLPVGERSQPMQYTSLNPAIWIWELMPYSFVVDWVYDIGGYLKNLETALHYKVNVQKAYVTYTTRYTCIGSGLSKTSGYIYGGKTEITRKRRVPFDGLPLPRPPSFRVNMGWQRHLSAASLLSQHLNKGRGFR